MSNRIKTHLPSIIVTVIVNLLVAGSLLVYADWSAPRHDPTRCDTGDPGCDAPVNVGGTGQTKSGSLVIGGQLGVNELFRAYSNAVVDGRLGIGTESPGRQLTIHSGGSPGLRLDFGSITLPATPASCPLGTTPVSGNSGGRSRFDELTCDPDMAGEFVGAGGTPYRVSATSLCRSNTGHSVIQRAVKDSGGCSRATANITGSFISEPVGGPARTIPGTWDLRANGSAGSALQFDLFGSPKVFFDSDGNVGIGTAAPEAKLHVDGDVIVNSISFRGGQKVCRSTKAVAAVPDWSDSLLVSSGWTVSNCRDRTLKIGAQRTSLGCVFDDGFYSEGTEGSINPPGIPDRNCGW